MTVSQHLEQTIRRVRQAALGVAGVRVVSSASLVILVQWTSEVGPFIWCAVLLWAALEWTHLPSGRESAARLDIQAGLPGELECAWDNRWRNDPTAEAQRRLAMQRFSGASQVRLTHWPHPGWLLPPLLCVGVILGTEPMTRDPAAAPEVSDSSGAQGLERDRESGSTESSDSDRDSRSTGARAVAADPSEAETVRGSSSDPRRTTAGVGQKAGDLAADPSATRGQRADGQRGEGIVLPVSGGTSPIGRRVAGRTLVGQSPPPVNAIADPSRPYPRRYHRVIKAWFDRNRP